MTSERERFDFEELAFKRGEQLLAAYEEIRQLKAALNQPPKEVRHTLRMGGSKVQEQIDALVATPKPAQGDHD